jgi:hypothetical protein
MKKKDFWNLRCGQCEFLFHGLGLLRCPSCGSDETERVDLHVLTGDEALLETCLSVAAQRFREDAAIMRAPDGQVNERLAQQFDRQAVETMALRERVIAAASITLATAREANQNQGCYMHRGTPVSTCRDCAGDTE